MNQGRAVFSQLISFLPDREFRRCVERYQGDSRLRGFSCWDQYLSMAFAQLTYRESLRDIEACLHSVGGKLYHLGFRGKVARSTLADANESHDWRIFADFAQVLIRIARPLYAHDDIGVDLDQRSPTLVRSSFARYFKEFIRISGMTHVRSSSQYPQSNGKIERRHTFLKSECILRSRHCRWKMHGVWLRATWRITTTTA